MAGAAERSETSADWAIRASAYSFSLSGAQPFDATWVRRARPTGVSVSIHEGLEAGILLTGGCEVLRGDHVVREEPGDVWLVGMWEPHQWRVTAPGTQQVAIVFLPEFLGEQAMRNGQWLRLFTCPPGERPARVSREARATTLAIGRELRRELKGKSRGWETAVRLCLERLLFTLSRTWTPPPQREGAQASAPRRFTRIMPALAAIHARPARRVSLAAAASACGLSPAQFGRVFGETMGVSFAKARLRSHLAYAARLLLTTDMPVEAIAKEAGFVDSSHLHRHFVRQYDTTPGAFREQGR